MRVAAGAIARKYCRAARRGHSRYLSRIGPLSRAGEQPRPMSAFCPDPAHSGTERSEPGTRAIDRRACQIATGVPPGLGEPVFSRLTRHCRRADGINAVKAVEIGAGTRAAAQRGSEHRDVLTPQGFKSNNAGGMLGGISSGQDIIAHATLKPTSSIQIPGETIDASGNAVEIVTTGRHDPCVGLRATPIAEAMLALVMDHLRRVQNGDVKSGADMTAISSGSGRCDRPVGDTTIRS